MSEDLEGCREVCDKNMQNTVEVLASKMEKLEMLREKTLECRCKLPKDSSVEVKRTPSLAAMCRCTPEDKLLESCSCTSLRSSLLSNLLSDLFGGLQSELMETGLVMPCQMLKCLEDKHNWDASSNVKTDLRNFFSKLLVGELEIAIATSIEKHHARWVGASCADTIQRSVPNFDPSSDENWQQKTLERRALQIAEQLAEKLFKERADLIRQQARDGVNASPPPCACDKPEKGQTNTGTNHSLSSPVDDSSALYPCLMDVKLRSSRSKICLKQLPPNLKHENKAKYKSIFDKKNTCIKASVGTGHRYSTTVNRCLDTASLKKTGYREMDVNTPECFRQTLNDFTLLETETDTIKKADDLDYSPCSLLTETSSSSCKKTTKIPQYSKIISTPMVIKVPKRVQITKKKGTDTKIVSKNEDKDKYKKKPNQRRPGQTFAVNLCLCGETIAPKNILHKEKLSTHKQKGPTGKNSSMPRIQIKASENKKPPEKDSCKSDCVCLNKFPSNNSINMFLDTLAKWNSAIVNSSESCKWGINKQSNDVLSLYNKFEENKIQLTENMDSEHKLKHKNKSVETSNEFTKLFNSSNVNREYEHQNPICLAVESEYMGAVDLEKSYETFCKCVNAKEIQKSKGRCLNNIINSDFPIHCLNSCKCCTKYLEKEINDQSLLLLPQTQTEKPSKALSNGDFQNSAANTNYKQYNSNGINDIGRGENIALQDKNNSKESDIHAKPYSDIGRVKNIIPQGGIEITEANKHATSLDHIVNDVELFLCDYDYQIKFLGVTLTNENAKNLEEPICENDHGVTLAIINAKNLEEPMCENNQGVTLTNENAKNLEETFYENNQTNKLNSFSVSIPALHTGLMKKMGQQEYWTGVTQTDNRGFPIPHTGINNEIPSTNTQMPSCKYNTYFTDLTKILNIDLNKKNGCCIVNDDKVVDTNSLIKIKDEPCVCCYNNIAPESQELEANTFQLLEEHLRERFKILKDNCKSSCLPDDEEDKFYSTVLKKIKQIISQSTSSILCECKKNEEAQETWKRAYKLLQEYLKLKMNRARCLSCTNPVSDLDYVVPSVTEKVCYLIQNDFKRLKKFCDCKKLKVSYNEKQRKPENEKNLQTQDSNTVEFQNRSSDGMKELFINEIIQTPVKKMGGKDKCCNNSNQCFNHSNNLNEIQFEIENQGFDNIKKLSETSHFETKGQCFDPSNNSDEMSQCHTIETKDHCSHNKNYLNETYFERMINLQDNESTDLIPSKIERLSSKSKMNPKVKDLDEKRFNYDVKSDPFQKNSLPFIGYTLECTCGKIPSQCTCSKAIVKKNHTIINDIWKTYKNPKDNDENTSYIMDNVYKFKDAYLCSKHILSDRNEEGKFCDFETFADCEEDIILKESDHGLYHEDQSTNTFYEEALNMKQYPNKDGHHVWYECAPMPEGDHDVNLGLDQFSKTKPNKCDTVILAEAETVTDKDRDSGSCGCETVPICHVKMLIQDIEYKLNRNQCVCDSLQSKVCPIHSRKSI